MDLFDLYAKITIDDGSYQKSISDVKKSAADLDSSFRKGFTQGVEGWMKKLTKAAAVAGAAFAAIGTIGMKYNAQMETYTTNFTVMLGDAEKAAQKVEELKTMAAKTPFEMTDLAGATQTLLAFGIASEDTTDIMKMLGDISLGNAEKFSSLATVFGQVSSAGKLQGQDLMQLINAGFNPLQVISKKTGESMASLKDRMSAGAIGIDEVTQAFQWATEEGGQFYNGMEAGAKTTAGLLSTLKDNVTSKIGELFSGLSEKFKELLPKVIDFVDKIDVSKVIGGLEKAVKTFKTMLPVITGVAAAVGTLYAIFKAQDAIANAIAGFQAFNAVLAANPILLVITLIAALITALATLFATNEDFRKKVISIWTSIKDFFSKVWETIKTIFSKVGEFFSTAFKKGSDAVITAWDSICDFFSRLWEGIKSVFAAVHEFFREKFQQGIDGVKSTWKSITTFFSSLWDGIKNVFAAVAGFFREKFQQGVDGVKSIWSTVTGFFSGIWTSIKNVFLNGWNEFKNIGKNLINGLWEGIKSVWNDVSNWFTNAWNSLTGKSVNVSVNSNSRRFGVNGSHAGGLGYVPFDGYIAELHRGEMVVPQAQADAMRNGSSPINLTVVSPDGKELARFVAPYMGAQLQLAK